MKRNRKHKSQKIRKKRLIISLTLLFLISIVGFITVYVKSLENRTKAQAVGSCNCPAGKCYSDCSRGTALGSCGDDLAGFGPDPEALHNYCYKEAECCKYGAMNCCWAERKYCLPKSCGGSQKNGCSNGWGDDFPFGCLNAPVRSDGELPMDREGNKIGAAVPANPPPTNPPVIPTNPPIVYPTETPVPIVYPTDTPYIAPTVYIQPTVYRPPVDYRQPIIYPPIPTTYNSQPTTIPTPTSKPVISEMVKDIGDFLQKTKASLLKFITVILP